jgi:hypothetical protein
MDYSEQILKARTFNQLLDVLNDIDPDSHWNIAGRRGGTYYIMASGNIIATKKTFVEVREWLANHCNDSGE